MKPKILSLVIASLFAGCGGGSSSDAPPPPVTDAPSRPGLFFTFFGAVDDPADPTKPVAGAPSSAVETASFITTIMTGTWGEIESPAGRQAIAAKAIRHMREARDRGVTSAIVMLQFILFDGRTYRGPPAIDELVAFLQAIQAAGLGDMVQAVYPIDEPDANGVGGDALRQMASDVRAALASVGMRAKLMTVVASPGAEQIDAFDVVGFDNYGFGAGVLADDLAMFESRLRPDQSVVLVPGGAEPWKTDPAPFYARAQSDPRIAGIMAFVWWDNFEPVNFPGARGIRSASTRCAYAAIGRKIRNATAAAC
jgi:hypothetical protein